MAEKFGIAAGDLQLLRCRSMRRPLEFFNSRMVLISQRGRPLARSLQSAAPGFHPPLRVFVDQSKTLKSMARSAYVLNRRYDEGT